jgi:hypothetical protein
MNRTPLASPREATRRQVTPERGGPTDPSHDAQLRRGIIETRSSRGVTLSVTVLFLALLYTIPLGQALLERIKGDDSPLLDVVRHAPTSERLRHFEDDVEQASYAKDFIQPRLQALLTRFGRVGNKRAVVGLGGWLYYTPGITHLGGPGFLHDDTIRTRERAALDSGDAAVHADPRPAIMAFHAALAKRGIRLIVFPVPDKAMLQPLELHGRRSSETADAPVARNLDWSRFVDEMRHAGVLVFDPGPLALHRGEAPHFLIQDTHWTPEWMEEVAAQLAIFVSRVVDLSPAASPQPLREVDYPVDCLGDVAVMLKLPDEQTIFAPQRVTIHQIVQDPTGSPWEPDANGEVLLLGDSFTNVFSMETMGWGTAAGLGAQLARALGRGVDVIAQNDSGAFATREALSSALKAGEDRLAGKKAVVWEFASRELSVGDWKPIDWNDSAAAEAP